VGDFLKTLSKKRSNAQPLPQKKQAWRKRKKEQGGKPCSKNCVDPISPKNLDLILIDGATLLGARQGSSRDLDHQTSTLRPA